MAGIDTFEKRMLLEQDRFSPIKNYTPAVNSTFVYSGQETDVLQDISTAYSKWHGYISIFICTVGMPLNIINIIVLTRKNMLTPINCILTWLAVADIATMISYVPFAYHFYCAYPSNSLSPSKNSWGWMQFLLVYLNFSATAHTISIWLAVGLAMLRHHHVHSPSKGNLTHIRRLVRARIIVVIIVVCSVGIMIPNYLSHRLQELQMSNGSSVYVFEDWKLGSKELKPIKMIALLLYSILAKLVPCILIIVYGGLLLRMLHKAAQQKKRLSEGNAKRSSSRTSDTTRTTTMLLIVIVLFLITELPQGVLILCSIFMRDFFDNVYIPLGDLMDILALLNNSINFVLYCTMSQEFRRTFLRLFFSCVPDVQASECQYYSSTACRDHIHTKSTAV